MSKWKIIEVLEQEGTYDGKWELTIPSYLLMKIINHAAAENDDDLNDMKNPKRLVVRVRIQTREVE